MGSEAGGFMEPRYPTDCNSAFFIFGFLWYNLWPNSMSMGCRDRSQRSLQTMGFSPRRFPTIRAVPSMDRVFVAQVSTSSPEDLRNAIQRGMRALELSLPTHRWDLDPARLPVGPPSLCSPCLYAPPASRGRPSPVFRQLPDRRCRQPAGVSLALHHEAGGLLGMGPAPQDSHVASG